MTRSEYIIVVEHFWRDLSPLLCYFIVNFKFIWNFFANIVSFKYILSNTLVNTNGILTFAFKLVNLDDLLLRKRIVSGRKESFPTHPSQEKALLSSSRLLLKISKCIYNQYILLLLFDSINDRRTLYCYTLSPSWSTVVPNGLLTYLLYRQTLLCDKYYYRYEVQHLILGCSILL